ncbi:hypothetical protein [Pseudoxanthomonas sp. PXM02]|uniref:hypothetical protein n=1 Tax=Pseudoxanthomonas sp. PXM02 TaxID=2769294 RepID=UPI001780E4EB|nr:hypothetical protein [Pseudoxanthomonas sp. PXM02]MBD9479408.1 hypothetical protein [Pseudoxanthomonas sp. PXM02]
MTDEARRKMAGLWESGISTAVRDLQWLYGGAYGPETQLTIDGLAEKALGDSFVHANDRVFLFELKATAGDRSVEWSKDGPKLAFKSLARSIEEFSTLRLKERQAVLTQLDRSHRGHHFVYWRNDPGQRGLNLKTGGLLFEPYLVASAEAMTMEEMCPELAKAIVKQYKLGEVVVDEDNSEFREIAAPSLDRLFTGEACAAKFDRKGKIANLGELGLDVGAMDLYVSWLIEKNDDKDLPIDGIICSRDGTFYRKISRVSHILAALRDLNTEPQSSLAGRTVKRSHEKPGLSQPIPGSLLRFGPSHRARRYRLGG